MPKNTEKQFENGLQNCLSGQFSPCHVLVALSGGADSVALLLFLLSAKDRYGFALSACHVNHGIRGKEAQRDEDFCTALCQQRGVPLVVKRVDVPAFCRENKLGTEEGARKLRYAALQEAADALGCDAIATAHNADDHLETVLFHLARGSGSRGMMGIPFLRGNIMRPLLPLTKEEILAFLQEKGQAFVTDSTNEDDVYRRNFIRKSILPAMRQLNPEAARASLSMSETLREDEAFLCSLLPDDFPDLARLVQLPDALLRRLLAREYEKAGGAGLTRTHLVALTALVRSGKTGDTLCLPSKISALRARTHLVFVKTVRAKKSPILVEKAEKHPLVLKNDSHASPFAHIFVLESGTDAKKIENFKKVYNFVTTCALKSAILSGGAYYRSRMAGDTVHFGGMTRKVKKLLWQSGLSPKARDSLPILCDEKGIVWLPGFPPREDMVPGDGEETAILCCVMP